MSQLRVYALVPPTSLRHFVEFWAKRYYYRNEHLYTDNINGPHTSESLTALFKWKIGDKLFAKNLPLVKSNFIDRLAEAKGLVTKLAGTKPREFAQIFVDHFTGGGPIWRIFWLHCWDHHRCPIYDQHVHRAMTFIKDKETKEEIANFSTEKKLTLYLGDYLPFFSEFDGMNGREVDKALWQFGKSLKDQSLPRLKP